MEDRYRDSSDTRGRSSSVFAFAILFGLNIAFAYLEYKASGLKTTLPMYGYLFTALVAAANLAISQFSTNLYWLSIRLLVNGVMSMVFVMTAVYLQKYSAYHSIEMTLLLIWLGSLNSIRFDLTLLLNVITTSGFLVVMQVTEVSRFWIVIVAVLLICADIVGGSLSYLFERQRRMLFLQAETTQSMHNRHEMWAFTLIDLDLALSGILNFNELIDMLKNHLEPVIEFESYIMTALEGQGPKPVADKVEGELFENEDNTLWPEDLLGKLAQTRQATVSAEFEETKGIFGITKKRFTSYRLDIPVFNDSKLMGIISLRRTGEPFDELDMISSVSIASQAMLIFKRTARDSAVILNKRVADPVVPKPDPNVTSKLASTQSSDMNVTDFSATNPEHIVAPDSLIKKIKDEEAQAKKTITLLSRENADKIAIDRYRTAAVDGEPLSILIIEVDGLSKLREQDGDQVAYKVFAAIVKYIFSRANKEMDVLGRYGQNGLSLLMPNIDMNAAEKFAEMIRQYVEKARYKTAYGEKSATLSIGVAAFTDDTGDYSSMIKRADMALFVAKKNGRNCVKVRL